MNKTQNQQADSEPWIFDAFWFELFGFTADSRQTQKQVRGYSFVDVT